MPHIDNYAQMLQVAAAAGPVPVAVAAAEEYEVLVAVSQAEALGIVSATLVGSRPAIHSIAQEHGLNFADADILDEPDPMSAAECAIRLVASGQARVAIKGQLQTSAFLRAALDRRAHLRTSHLISHVGIFEVPGFSRLLFITDGGVVLFPTEEQKAEIVSNAILVARALGIAEPKVALVTASDSPSPDLPVSLEMARIAALQDRWQTERAHVDGPFLLDTAVSPDVAQQRGRTGQVAGRADVLVGPNVESVNIMAKAITYFAGGRMAGLVVGAKAPLVVGSRADPPETRLVCIAAGALVAAAMGDGSHRQ